MLLARTRSSAVAKRLIHLVVGRYEFSYGIMTEGDSPLTLRGEGSTKVRPPLGETLRGSLVERYPTCGNRDCKCARAERHWPVWYLRVTLKQSHRTGRAARRDQVEQVRRWIENDHRVKAHQAPEGGGT